MGSNFEAMMSTKETKLGYKKLVTLFLSNVKIPNYQVIIASMINNFKNLGCLMSPETLSSGHKRNGETIPGFFISVMSGAMENESNPRKSYARNVTEERERQYKKIMVHPKYNQNNNYC